MQKTKFKQTEIGMIPKDWEIKELKEIAPYINEKISLDEIDIKSFISTENMLPDKNGITIASSLPKVGKVTQFKEGDILFSNIRTYFKKLWLAKFSGGCSNDVLVIRGKYPINNKYLYYFLSQNKFFEFTVLTSKGTKMPRGDKNAIMGYNINIPSINEQQVIAKILSNLDSKIELNQQMNKTLEAIGQAIFKHWFVDFEFPNEKGKPYKSSGGDMVDSELGEIPKGWKIFNLIDLVSHLKPGTNYQPARVEEGIPFVNVRNVQNGFLDLKDVKYITKEEYSRVHQYWVPEEHDILITRIGTLGNVGVIRKEDLPLAVHYNSIDIKAKRTSFQFLYFVLKSDFFQKQYHNKKKQSVQEYVTIDEVEKLNLILPESFKKFEDIFISLFNKIEENFAEIHTLSQIRDSLLPKLMSGKIRVPVEVKK